MGKECGAWVSRRLWGGGNTSGYIIPRRSTAHGSATPQTVPCCGGGGRFVLRG